MFDIRIWRWSRLLDCHSRRYSLGITGHTLLDGGGGGYAVNVQYRQR